MNSISVKYYAVDLSIRDEVYLEKKFEYRKYDRVHGVSVMIKREEYTQ